MNFNIGDRVKCIDVSDYLPHNTRAVAPPLILNREYIVAGVDNCPICGIITLDVGIASSGKYTNCKCGARYPNKSDTHWCSSIRFVKALEKKEYLTVSTNIEIEEIILN